MIIKVNDSLHGTPGFIACGGTCHHCGKEVPKDCVSIATDRGTKFCEECWWTFRLFGSFP